MSVDAAGRDLATGALPLTSGTSATGCPIRDPVLQVCHDAVCESSRALSATKPLYDVGV